MQVLVKIVFFLKCFSVQDIGEVEEWAFVYGQV